MGWVLQGKTPARGSFYHKGRKVKIEYRDYYLIYDVPKNKPLYAGCGQVVFDSRINTTPSSSNSE